MADQVAWLPGDNGVVHGPSAEVLARCDVVPPLAALAHRLGWPQVPTSVRDARRRVQRERITIGDPPPAGRLPAGEPVASLTGLGVRYGDVVAVDAVDRQLAAGTVVALMGRNGAGKSSLMWAMQGAVPSSGVVEVAGTDRAPLPANEVGHLSPWCRSPPPTCCTCHRGRRVPAVGRRVRRRRNHRSRPTRLGVELPGDRHPRDLSEGQQLALVLAIQLAGRPKVLLLDEPTRGLDYTMKAQLARIVGRLAAGGTCVVISTHDVEFAAAATGRAIIMADADIVADGPTRAVLTSSPAFSPQMAKVFHPSAVLTPDEVVPVPVASLGGLA